MTPATETRRAFDAMFPSVRSIGLHDRHAVAPEQAEPLSATAIAIGQEALIADLSELGDFLAGSENEREPSKDFGPISNKELVEIMFTSSYYRQVFEANRELRARFFEAKSEYIHREALSAEQA